MESEASPVSQPPQTVMRSKAYGRNVYILGSEREGGRRISATLDAARLAPIALPRFEQFLSVVDELPFGCILLDAAALIALCGLRAGCLSFVAC
jgi:hypothetical protein